MCCNIAMACAWSSWLYVAILQFQKSALHWVSLQELWYLNHIRFLARAWVTLSSCRVTWSHKFPVWIYFFYNKGTYLFIQNCTNSRCLVAMATGVGTVVPVFVGHHVTQFLEFLHMASRFLDNFYTYVLMNVIHLWVTAWDLTHWVQRLCQR